MKDWPAGSSIVLQSQFNRKNIIAIGYKYTSKSVVCFVASLGADLTTNGDPYLAKFLSDEHENYRTREVFCPQICSHYYSLANVIDIHNQIR